MAVFKAELLLSAINERFQRTEFMGARMSSRCTSGPNTSRCGGSRRSDNRRERKWVGSWVGGFEFGLAISRADKYARKGILGGPPARHSGGPCMNSNHELDRILKSRNLLILKSR
jgi:hypothetical protein